MDNIVLVSIVGLIALFVYFLPAVVAYGNKKRQRDAILLLNLLLGWTLIGWVVAIVWASCKD